MAPWITYDYSREIGSSLLEKPSRNTNLPPSTITLLRTSDMSLKVPKSSYDSNDITIWQLLSPSNFFFLCWFLASYYSMKYHVWIVPSHSWHLVTFTKKPEKAYDILAGYLEGLDSTKLTISHLEIKASNFISTPPLIEPYVTFDIAFITEDPLIYITILDSPWQ